MKRRPADTEQGQGPVTENEFYRVLELCQRGLSGRVLTELERIAGGPLEEVRRENEERPYDVTARAQHALNDVYWAREGELAPQLRHGDGWHRGTR